MFGTLLYYLRLLYLLIDGGNLKGIRSRTWFAVAVAVIAIIADTTCVYFLYDQIPMYVPAMFDWGSNIVAWAVKDTFWTYEVERLLVLVTFLAIGFAITWKYPKSLVAKRTRCLLAEVAMLIITTGVGIGIAELFIEANRGSYSTYGYAISDNWEFCIMLFWFAISMAEYICDYRKLKKASMALTYNQTLDSR